MRSDAQANRDRVLAAAEEVFGESGEAGSTEEIARRAGVGVGTVFRHFPTKQRLVEATVVRHFALLTEQTRALAGDGDPGAAFRTLIHTLVGGTPAKRALIALLGEFGADARAASEGLRAAVRGLLVRAQEAGAVRADVTVDDVYVLIRALAGVTGGAAGTATAERAVDIVLDGLAAR